MSTTFSKIAILGQQCNTCFEKVYYMTTRKENKAETNQTTLSDDYTVLAKMPAKTASSGQEVPVFIRKLYNLKGQKAFIYTSCSSFIKS